MQVTTKGAGLNPNAKVWQEHPTNQNNIPEWTDDAPWLLTHPSSTAMTDGNLEKKKNNPHTSSKCGYFIIDMACPYFIACEISMAVGEEMHP